MPLLPLLDRLNPRRSLRARFALVLGATSLLLAFLAGLGVERLERRQLEATLGHAAHQRAQLLARVLDQAVQQRLLQLRQVAGQPLLASGLMEPGDLRDLLERLRATQPEFAWLGLANPQGRVDVATNAFLQGRSLAASPAFTGGRRGPWVGRRHGAGPLEGLLPHDRDGQPPQLLDLAVPVVDFNGQPLGVLLAELDWVWVKALVDSLHHNEQAAQTVALDADGAVVLAWPGQTVSAPTLAALQALQAEPSAGVLTWPDGVDYLTAAARTPVTGPGSGLDLLLLVRQDAHSAFAGAEQLRQRLMQAGVLATLATVVLAAVLAGAVVRPLRRLADVANRRHAGESVPFPPTPDGPGDEVQALAATLHAMDQAVRQRLADQQELNAELEQRVSARTAQLQAANDELDSFAYAVSHDLRAPLRAMGGFSQALPEDHAPKLDAEARLYLDQIILASQRMGALIDGLLSLSRSLRGDLHDGPVDLGELAQRAFNDLRLAEPQRQVSLTLTGNLRVHGDSRMLDAVIRNLVGNAWKYTARRDDAQLHLQEQVRNGERWFCMADNGAGFDMDHAGRLFQAFSRLHRQDEFPGLGIGLATVQRIVRRHGGRIEAQGQVGQGARFSFTLPSAPLQGRPTP
ncbi:bacteriophytochrome (light-regulated signal transduction histidine kinase) [Burkholderiales bacterium JOSHI_001]|nr:bacteriophytochrome (light-regulated signal transduction histidine kinase) [Burkholderiales bacterium JOSHI_001]